MLLLSSSSFTIESPEELANFKLELQNTPPNEVVMEIIDALDKEHAKLHSLANILAQPDILDNVYRQCTSHALHLLCRRLVASLVASKQSEHHAFRDACAIQLLNLLSPQFALIIKFSWKDLIAILEDVMPLCGMWSNSLPISKLVQYLLNDLSKFLERITSEALNGDVELAKHFAFNPECGSRLFETIAGFLTRFPVIPHEVVLSCFTTLKNLLPYFYPQDQPVSFEKLMQFLIQKLHTSNQAHNHEKAVDEESKASQEQKAANVTPCSNDDMEKQRKLIIREIISTEETYVSSLEQIMRTFIQPVKDRNVLNKDQISKLFSNIEAIFDFHKVFFSHLQQNPDSIASIFLKLADFLKMYTLYVNSYESCIEALCELKEHSKFQNFMKSVGGSAGAESAESQLMALLITPIQRIPRYLLLLKEMLKNTPALHPETELLEKAVEKIAAIAEHVNQSKKRAEDFTKVIAIQGKINAGIGIGMASMLSRRKRISLAGPQRRLIRDGIVLKQSKGTFKKASPNRFYLFNDMLLWTTCSYRFKGITPLAGAQIKVLQNGTHFPLEIVIPSSESGSKSVTMLFDIENTRDLWRQDLENAIEVIAKGRIITKSPGMHLEKDVSSLLPNRSDDSGQNLNASSTSIAFSPKNISSMKSWSGEEEPKNLSEKEVLFHESVKIVVMMLLVYHDVITIDSINLIDKELLDFIIKSKGTSYSPILSAILDYWIVRFEVIDIDLPMRSDHKAFKDNLLNKVLDLLPASLSLALSADCLQTSAVVFKDSDSICGLPLPQECWGQKVVACLSSASKIMDTTAEFEDFLINNESSTDWRLKASAAFVIGIHSQKSTDESSVNFLLNCLSNHRQEDRRVLDAVVWAFCKAGESQSTSHQFLSRNDVFVGIMRSYVQITNRLVASIESDSQLLENICRSTALLLKVRTLNIGNEVKQNEELLENLAESFALNILLQAKTVVNYDLRSTSVWLFECLSVLFSTFKESCSKPTLYRVAFPKLIELLDYKDNPGPEVALGALMDSASSEIVGQFADQIASKAKAYNRHSLIPKLTSMLSQSVSFVSFIESHSVEKYIIEVMESASNSRSTLLMVLDLAAKVVQDCSQRQSDSSLAIMRNICNSISILLSHTHDEELIEAICTAQCKCIQTVGPVLNNTWCRFLKELDSKGDLAQLQLSKRVSKARLQTLEALRNSNCIQVFAINAATIIEQVCRGMEILYEDSPLILCDGMKTIGFIVSTLKHRVFEFLYPVILFMSKAIECKDSRKEVNFALRETGCALFAQIARAAEPESINSINWESRKYLATLLGQCQDGISECLTELNDQRVHIKASMALAQTIISLGEQFVPYLASTSMIQSFISKFPIYPLGESFNEYVQCVQDNLILYASIETIISLHAQQKCRPKDFQVFADVIVQRLPALIELGRQLAKENSEMESKIVLVGRNIVKHLKKSMDRNSYKASIGLLSRAELERLKEYLT